MLIVSDCMQVPNATGQEKFVFFEEGQKNHIKSLVAYPIFPFGGSDGSIPAAVVIDTNVAGHFKDEDQAEIRNFLDEFASRLQLERNLLELLGN